MLALLPTRFLNEQKLLATLRPNLIYPLTLTATLLRAKRIHDRATLVFISSQAASKAALDAGVLVLAQELSRTSIRVKTLHPGYVDTPMTTKTLAQLPQNPVTTVIPAETIARQITALLADS